jgi:hypothetical protein
MCDNQTKYLGLRILEKTFNKEINICYQLPRTDFFDLKVIKV